MTSGQLDTATITEPANALLKGDEPKALLSFWLGPVQSFIATAHTTRDLWTGSYLLSWLTLHAIKVVVQDCSPDRKALLFPAVENNPLLDRLLGVAADNVTAEDLLRASVPNLFLAQVPLGRATSIKKKVTEAIPAAWRKIAKAVRDRLRENWDGVSHSPWDAYWDNQVDNFFDVRCLVLPPDGRSYPDRFKQIGRLMAAHKMLRQIPPPEEPDDNRPKGSLDGSRAQMGPIRISFKERAEWWKEARERVKPTIRSYERLSAVSLVKRFAWKYYLQEELGSSREDLSFPDTATVAARLWLNQYRIPWEREQEMRRWSGQWLHWGKRDEGEDDNEPACLEDLFRTIIGARREQKPPAYYVVLTMDGDSMGKRVREAAESSGMEEAHRELSGRLAGFAAGIVPDIVESESHLGKLVYAGGDDVLALLPTETALACADAVRICFGKQILGATMSAGLVVAHYKTDLRFVLQEARDAEQRAKAAGRDCLCLRVLKRGGEHASAVCPWGHIQILQKLVWKFVGRAGPSHLPPSAPSGDNTKLRAASDRWAYRLLEETPTLDKLADCPDAVEAEIERLLEHSEGAKDLKEDALQLWEERRNHWENPGQQEIEDRTDRFASLVNDYGFLIRAASFLARGKEGE